MKKNKKGFTLIEMLVVISIVGILAAVAFPLLFKNIEKAKVAELLADINAIKSSMLACYSEDSKILTDKISIDGGELLPDRDGNPSEAFKELGIESISDPFKVDSYKVIGKINTGLKLYIMFPDTIAETILSRLNKAKLDFKVETNWSNKDTLIINIT